MYSSTSTTTAVTTPTMLQPQQQQPPTALPPLPPFSLTAPTISECSSGISDLSAAPQQPAPPPPPPYASVYAADAPVCALSDLPYSAPTDALGPLLSERPGYIRILPRTSAAAGMYKKRCETCSRSHDGSFGAGRFCSSRCARTVGGLAHRKKRMLERGAKARHARENPLKTKKGRVGKFSSLEAQVPVEVNSHLYTSPHGDGVMSIRSLLNPCS